MHRLRDEVESQGGKSILLSANLAPKEEGADTADILQLDPFNAKSLEEAMKQASKEGVAYVFVELPCLLEGQRLPVFIHQMDLVITVESTLTVWRAPQQEVIQNLSDRLKDQPMLLFLNGIKPRFLDQVVGEVPKRRNKVVAVLRGLLRGRINTQKSYA